MLFKKNILLSVTYFSVCNYSIARAHAEKDNARDFHSKVGIEWPPGSLWHIWLTNPIDALIVLHRLEKSG